MPQPRYRAEQDLGLARVLCQQMLDFWQRQLRGHTKRLSNVVRRWEQMLYTMRPASSLKCEIRVEKKAIVRPSQEPVGQKPSTFLLSTQGRSFSTKTTRPGGCVDRWRHLEDGHSHGNLMVKVERKFPDSQPEQSIKAEGAMPAESIETRAIPDAPIVISQYRFARGRNETGMLVFGLVERAQTTHQHQRLHS